MEEFAGAAAEPGVDGEEEASEGVNLNTESRLFQATVERKRAEQDAMLLANRIALLRKEEQKASKKIQDTHKRTREIVDLRRRNEENRVRREDKLFAQEKELDDRRDGLQQGREQQQRRLASARGNAQTKKFALRDEIRAEKRELRQRKHGQMEDEYARAASKRDRIRTAAIVLTQHRNQILNEKKSGASDRVERRIATEAQRRKEREDAILKMEREEVELIQRLQNTQQKQRAAYDQLEEVLQQPQQENSGGAPTPAASAPAPQAAAPVGQSFTAALSRPKFREPRQPSKAVLQGGADEKGEAAQDS